jgi:hypothetical protein
VRRARGTRYCVALCLGFLVFACHRASEGAAAAASPHTLADSLQGIVRVVGVDALPRITLSPDEGSPAITLTGPASLRRVAGLRVSVVGQRAGTTLTVTRFVVIEANGVAATDGMLTATGDRIELVTADGTRHPLANPAPGLRAAVGRRVWISGPLDGPTVAYGIIE